MNEGQAACAVAVLRRAPFADSLERVEADAPHGVDEVLVGGAALAVGVDHRLDHVGHLVGRERRADDLAGDAPPLKVEPSEPPRVIWYHSAPSLSTPRMPMWPL